MWPLQVWQGNLICNQYLKKLLLHKFRLKRDTPQILGYVLICSFSRSLLSDDHRIQRAAIDCGAGDLEDQFEGVISQDKLTRIIPAHLIGSCS